MGTKNSTTTSTQELPGYINDAYKGLIKSAGQTGSTAYTPYTGGFTPDQQQAFENIRSLWGSGDASFGAASDAFGRSLVPTSDTVSSYMSPYMSQVIQGAMGNMQEQNAQQQQQVIGDAIAKGAMGGNRVGVAQAELGRQQKLADNAAIANLYQQGYGTALGAAQADKTAALQAAQGYAGLGQTQMQTNLAQAASQLGAGTQQQEFDYQQYLNKLAFPYQQQSWLASIYGGLGSTAGGTTTQKTPQGNIFSQLLGAGLGIASLFKDGGRVTDRPHLAVGGIPYMNDNQKWPSFLSQSARQPYANDNGGFGSYVPEMKIASGSGRFPTIQQQQQQEEPFTPTSAMREGASNIKNWLSPTIAGGAAIPSHGFIPGITGPRLFSHGGAVARNGYAGGGVPLPAYNDLDAFYRGILYPGAKGGIVGAPVIPPPPPRPLPDVPTVDTVNALDADRLGLGVDMTPERALAYQGEDPYVGQGFGGAGPTETFRFEKPARVVPGGNAPGEVIYGAGEQFVTRPREDGYSRNGMEALQSLFGGKGLNVAPDVRNGLLTAGLGMMASKSPFVLQGVGEGGLAGVQAWKDYQTMERENALARAGIGQKGEELAQRALEVGASTNVQDATAGSIRAGTAGNIYDYKYTPLGVQVTDKTTGAPGPIYPYGSMMPDGTIAERPSEEPMTLFSTEVPANLSIDPRLMTEVGAQQAIGQADAVIRAQQAEAAAAQNTQQLLQEMKHNLSTLPENGVMAPGTDFKERAALAKGINTYMQVFGLDPYFPRDEIAAAEDLNKLTNRLGFDLSKMLGSNEAASIVMTGIESVPGGANAKESAEKIIAGLEAANRRRIDLYHFTQNWAAKSGGSILNAEETFNRQNPPELYALSSYVPVEDMEYLRQHPETAADFNAEYGDGKNVARFVLGR